MECLTVEEEQRAGGTAAWPEKPFLKAPVALEPYYWSKPGTDRFGKRDR